MSVKEVTALRKSGHLVEAYNQALSELREEDNEWTEMSLFWVLRDLCKEDIDRNNLQKAEERLYQMEDLLPNMLDDNGAGQKAYDYLIRQVQPNAGIIVQLSELSKTNATDAYNQAVAQFGNRGENLSSKLHEDFAWIVYRYMKGNLGTLSSYQVRVLLNDYMQLNNPRPSKAHSMILNFALNFSKEHFDFKFYNFLKLWGISNLSYDDFHNSYSVEGHTIPSLVSRIMRVFVETQQEVDWKEFFVSLESNPSCVSHKELVDQLRQPSFWNLMNLQKEGKWNALWSSFTSYAKEFSDFGPSHWHSEILKIANRFMSEENSRRFISFTRWRN